MSEEATEAVQPQDGEEKIEETATEGQAPATEESQPETPTEETAA